ncbi:MAG TPA: rhomboid family intramembrane serine protease [Chlamydiales bacterium]|nr:rhomboid family intramembrane serine protease [Chlamydiales bacterium]
MSYRTNYRVGPEFTPHLLKVLIWTTVGVSLAAALYTPLLSLLALSLNGIEQFYLWQFFTYLFIHPGPLSFPFFLHIAFNMYLLWVFGSSILSRSQSATFLSLYFGSALFAGALALGAMFLFQLPFALLGSSTPLYAVLMAWVLLNPDAELHLFFLVPFRARWLILGLIGANLLIDLGNRDWINLSSYVGATLFGYFFAILVWREQSPFPFLRSFERMLLRTLERLRHLGKKGPIPYRHSKVYDIHSGNPVLEDDQFMDAMLARISLYGEDSLSAEEKKRMHSISARKAADKK